LHIFGAIPIKRNCKNKLPLTVFKQEHYHKGFEVTLEERIDAFHKLGEYLRTADKANRHSLLHEPMQFNPWFIQKHVELAIANVSRQLDRTVLSSWMSKYPRKEVAPCNVGVVMAGNIPLVGFHDLMTVLLSGHHLVVRPSTQDTWLILSMIDRLKAIDPRLAERISVREQLKNVDAVIATGSDNTARYFEYYFRQIPHLIRKNRSSCAILTGLESKEELRNLGLDIFSFFGLGCRNVSKLFVPAGYDMTQVLGLWGDYEYVIHHHKYSNNYDYNKSILLVNRTPFYDNGFVLVTRSNDIVSPISVLYYEEYLDKTQLSERLSESRDKIQCIVGLEPGLVPFGKAQYPEPDDYADGVDTMTFLLNLS
jgi:hypothetical protein